MFFFSHSQYDAITINEPSASTLDMIFWLETLMNKTRDERHKLVIEKRKELNAIVEKDSINNFYANWLNDISVSLYLQKKKKKILL